MSRYRKRITLPSLGNVSVNFYCSSAILFDFYEKLGEFERQKSINHLGLISKEIDGASHTRYEYLMLQCALSDVLDKLHKGSAAQGSIKVDGISYNGNCLLKSWFMLSNFGHLKNTYGDEKTLIHYAIKRQGFKSRLLNIIRSPQLKEWAEKVINNFEYQKFHYVIAIYRMYKDMRQMVNKQDELAKLMELLLISTDDIPYKVNETRLLQLRSLFKKIRDIAIVTIDGHYSHTPITIDLISSLVSFDEIEGGVFGRDISSSLNPLRSMLCEGIYLNPYVLANQRSYEVNALKKLNEMPYNDRTYGQLVNKGLNDGFFKNHKRDLSPFYRIKIPKELQSSSSFYSELRQISNHIKNGCPNVEVYLDVNPFNNVRYVDFFINDEFSSEHFPKFLFNIISLVTNQLKNLIQNEGHDFFDLIAKIESSAIEKGVSKEDIKGILKPANSLINNKIWESAEKSLFPSYRDLLWSLIRYFIKDNYRIEIEPSTEEYENYGISIPGLGNGYLIESLDKAHNCEIENDEDRAHEISMLKHLSKRPYDGYQIVFMVRIKILDLSQSPDKMIATDIDAALLKISETSFSLDLFEAKNMKKNREGKAQKELKDNLVPVLNGNGTYRIDKVTGYGARLKLTCKK